MMLSTTRTDWIHQRTSELMLDTGATVEIIEDIQNHGGLAHKGFCAAIGRVMVADTKADEDRALADACQIMQAFAYQRAAREFDGRHHGH